MPARGYPTLAPFLIIRALSSDAWTASCAEEARSTAKRLEIMTTGTRGPTIGKLLAGADEHVAAIPFLRRVDGATAANLLGGG